MTHRRKIFVYTGLGVVTLCAGAVALRLPHDTRHGTRETKGSQPIVVRREPAEEKPEIRVAPGTLTSPALQLLDEMEPADKERVSIFLANTSGPLDNYLLSLEGMVDVANARYGEPDKESWARAVPIARVLEQNMCDCAQRNWLKQFIALGETGLADDLDKYHAQGRVMASVGRFNADPVNNRLATGGAEQ